MAGEKGFEPLHAGIKIRCLNQLGDSPTQPFINCLVHFDIQRSRYFILKSAINQIFYYACYQFIFELIG